MELITISTIFSCIEYYQNISQFIGFAESKDTAITSLVESPYKAAGMALLQAQNSSIADERLSLLRDARRSYTQAITLEKKEKLALSYVGLALCHHLLGDDRNCENTMRSLTSDVSHSGLFGSIKSIKQIKEQTYEYLGEKSPWLLEDERVQLVHQANLELKTIEENRVHLSSVIETCIFSPVNQAHLKLSELRAKTITKVRNVNEVLLNVQADHLVENEGIKRYFNELFQQWETEIETLYDQVNTQVSRLNQLCLHISAEEICIDMSSLQVQENFEVLVDHSKGFLNGFHQAYLFQIHLGRTVQQQHLKIQRRVEELLKELCVDAPHLLEGKLQPYLVKLDTRSTAQEAQERLNTIKSQKAALQASIDRFQQCEAS